MLIAVRTAALTVCLAVLAQAAWAHEVDQYTLPDEDLVDQGAYWDQLCYDAVAEAVQKTNRDIQTARNLPLAELRKVRLAQLHSPGTMAWRVRRNLPSAFWAIESLEMKMRTAGHRDGETGGLIGYRAPVDSGTFSHTPALPDPRQLGRIFFMRCSMIKVHDHYIGTDKIGHFIAMGYLYYKAYSTSRLAGYDQDKAMAHAVNVGKWGPLSEGGLLGMLPTGIYSNADMAANYLGMKYYVNLTEPVKLHGHTVPAMLMRDGDFWRLRPHVRPRGGYFAMFVSEHFDEALNPGVYEWGLRAKMRSAIKGRREQLLDWYASNDASKRNRQYFDRIQKHCQTYFGETYGHFGDKENLITLGAVCFDQTGSEQLPRQREKPVQNIARRAPRPGPSVWTRIVKADSWDESTDYSVYVGSRAKTTESGVRVSVKMPRGVQLAGAEGPMQYDRATRTLSWYFEKIPPGAWTSLTFSTAAVDHTSSEPTVAVTTSADRSKLAQSARIPSTNSSRSPIAPAAYYRKATPQR